MTELARIMAYGRCHEDVTRKGISQPCEKTAVAVRIDERDGDPYPVCAYHSRGHMVALTHLVAAIPDRDFVDDMGRRWEWCGGIEGTWAWRVTHIPRRRP
jgi:hypothetical protein